MDIRLYRRSGTYSDLLNTVEEIVPSSLSEAPTTGIEVIASRVTKFMLTTIGSDVLDPEYGSYLTSYVQISQDYLPKLRLELSEDLDRCAEYIRTVDEATEVSGDRLRSLSLRDLKYSNLLPDRLDVYLDIRTTTGGYATLELPVRT
jgi:hypothetical protein